MPKNIVPEPKTCMQVVDNGDPAVERSCLSCAVLCRVVLSCPVLSPEAVAFLHVLSAYYLT